MAMLMFSHHHFGRSWVSSGVTQHLQHHYYHFNYYMIYYSLLESRTGLVSTTFASPTSSILIYLEAVSSSELVGVDEDEGRGRGAAALHALLGLRAADDPSRVALDRRDTVGSSRIFFRRSANLSGFSSVDLQLR